MSLAELRVSGDAAWPVALMSGEIDLSNVDVLESQLADAVTNRARGLVLDLSEVTYLDSTGLRLIYGLARRMSERQQSLRLVVPETSRISRVLTIAGVGSVAEVVGAHPPPSGTGREEAP